METISTQKTRLQQKEFIPLDAGQSGQNDALVPVETVREESPVSMMVDPAPLPAASAEAPGKTGVTSPASTPAVSVVQTPPPKGPLLLQMIKWGLVYSNYLR